jgi:hypothetical protein
LKDSFVPRSGVALVSVPGCDAEEIVDATDGRSICMVVSSVLATGDDAALSIAASGPAGTGVLVTRRSNRVVC